MTTLVEVIVNDVSTLLQDVNKDRWSDADLMRWLGEAEQLIAMHKPESVATKVSLALVVGPDQSIPADGLMALRFRRNTVTKTVVQLVDEDTLNRIDPAWPGKAAQVDVVNVMYDPKVDPLGFMVSPQNNATGSIEMVYAKIPAPVASTTAPISVSDSFVPVIKDYIMYRSLQMETEGQNLPRSAGHLQTFLIALGLNSEAYRRSDPNVEVEANG